MDKKKINALLQNLENEIKQKAVTNLEKQKPINQIASAIGGLYYAIYHISLTDDSFICFREDNKSVNDVVGTRGSFSQGWKIYIDQYVSENYKEIMLEFGNYKTLSYRLRNVDMISQIYQRAGIGWVKAQYIVGERDAEGKAITVILTVGDVNNEVKLDKQRKKAQFEAEHDPLTKLYNRNGFNRISTSKEYKNNKIGFMLMDIDNFKALNDCHGHELGDHALVAVANNLKQYFRDEDKIFRLGGDEIAILLYNCDKSIWKSICKKLRDIHSSLAREFADGSDVNVTLSVGVCFSKSGYREDLYMLADEALYVTKQNGRAGCTLINEEHEILEKWSDHEISFHPGHTLEYKTSGMFRMEIPKDSSKPRKIVCGDGVKTAFGAPVEATPEECYQVWEKGIPPEYQATVHEAMQMMVNEGHAECTYLWNHPLWGKVYVRSNAFGENKDGTIILTGLHHVLRDTNLVEKKADDELINTALSDMFFSSYYWDLKNDSYATIKASPTEEYTKMGEKKTSDKIEEFITYVVEHNDRPKMREFLNPKTIQERLGTKSYIACKYRSISLDEWTQARLIPVKFNAKGELTHVVLVILVLSSVDGENVYPIDYDKKSLISLYNNVPAGIVMYEWNGKQLKTVHISEYYAKEYGDSLYSEEGTNKGGPDFKRVHPDDLEGYKNAILHSLVTTHELQYMFRVWNRTANKYVWVKVDAVAKPQSDGTMLVYAVYTDISEQKLAEQRLEKSNVAILAALSATEQFIYEYDPVKHTSTCFSDENGGYQLEKVIRDYPECFRKNDFLHPEDVEKFIDTVHKIDQGAETAACEIRVKKGNQEHWHSCVFHSFYDLEKGYKIAILTVVDITLSKTMVQNFEERFNSLMAIEQNVFSMCMLNLTQNTFKMLREEKEVSQFIDETKSFETVMMNIVPNILGDEEKKTYQKLFSRENLLQQAEKGNMHVEYDVLLKMTDTHYEWVNVAVDMVRNLMNSEISGVAYCKSSQTKHMANALLDNALRQDYMFAAIIIKDTDEFYLYDTHHGEFRNCMEKFWDVALAKPNIYCSKNVMEYLKAVLVKGKMLKHLEEHEEFRYAFDSYHGENGGRLEINLSYIDSQKTMILASVRNITDTLMVEKWKFESEHDRLTGLLNREAVFRKCSEILEAHPEEQFIMLHGDVRHFHLYNTFFGESAGDELLCFIAGLMRNMGKDYEYCAYGRIESDVFCSFFPISPGCFEKHINYLFYELEKFREDFSISAAIGVYLVDDPTMSIETMFSRATIAAKSSKANLFGRISRFDESMERELNDTQMVTGEMNTALEKEQFQVYLQPKYDLRSQKIVGSEALARWIHPERGLISPGIFIPVIEKNGSIAELDRYMWEHVCQILRRWLDEEKTVYPISVNISRISMYSKETVPFLINLVRKYNLNPKYLELELTESAYMDDPEELKRMLKELQEFGFTILIDDFGSGYSSLNTLRELPVDILKLDMKFLSDSQSDKRGTAILETIVRMSKLLELPIVVEGVEKEAQAKYLCDIGCEYAQGFLFAKPMPVLEYEQLIGEKK